MKLILTDEVRRRFDALFLGEGLPPVQPCISQLGHAHYPGDNYPRSCVRCGKAVFS